MKKYLSLIVIASTVIYAYGMEHKMMHMQNMSMGKFIVDNSLIPLGKKVFKANCIVCHGVGGVGGKFKVGDTKPPALNGVGHSHVTHHSPQSLMRTIMRGEDGMPSFKGKLNMQERRAIFAYIHSLWSKKVQKEYDKKFHLKIKK